MKGYYHRQLECAAGETSAWLELACGGLPASWVVTGLFVPPEHRGKGIARALMAECLAEADRSHIMLRVVCSPYGDGLSFRQLRAWYQRLGFLMDKASQVKMTRLPQPIREVA